MPLILLSMPAQPQDMLLKEVLRNLRISIDLEGFTDVQPVIFKGFFHLSTSRS